MQALELFVPDYVLTYIDRNDWEQIVQTWLEYYRGWIFEEWYTDSDGTNIAKAKTSPEEQEYSLFYY